MRRMPQRVRRRVFRLGLDGPRPVELRQLYSSVAVRGPQHGDVLPDVIKPDDTFCPAPFEWPLALQFHAEFYEERNNSLKVLDDNKGVVHPLDRHAVPPSLGTATVAASAPERLSGGL